MNTRQTIRLASLMALAGVSMWSAKAANPGASFEAHRFPLTEQFKNLAIDDAESKHESNVVAHKGMHDRLFVINGAGLYRKVTPVSIAMLQQYKRDRLVNKIRTGMITTAICMSAVACVGGAAWFTLFFRDLLGGDIRASRLLDDTNVFTIACNSALLLGAAGSGIAQITPAERQIPRLYSPTQQMIVETGLSDRLPILFCADVLNNQEHADLQQPCPSSFTGTHGVYYTLRNRIDLAPLAKQHISLDDALAKAGLK